MQKAPHIRVIWKKLLNTVTVNLGCSCRRPNSHPSSSPSPNQNTTKPTTTTLPPTKTTTITELPPPPPQPSHRHPLLRRRTSSGGRLWAAAGRWRWRGFADPYRDFRASKLQMIVENEMYTKDDLREVLACFLRLNSPCLHGVIIRAFIEIWNTFSSLVPQHQVPLIQ